MLKGLSLEKDAQYFMRITVAYLVPEIFSVMHSDNFISPAVSKS